MRPRTNDRLLVLYYRRTTAVTIPHDQPFAIEAIAEHRFGISPETAIRIMDRDRHLQPLEVGAGELVYIPAGLGLRIQTSSPIAACLYFIHFDILSAPDQLAPSSPALTADLQLFRMPQMKNWLAAFVAEREARTPAAHYLLQSRLYALASACMAAVDAAPASKAPRKLKPTEWVEQAKRYIADNYESYLDMDSLACSLGVSTSQFYRKFREYMGISPQRFLITNRLYASLKLLAEPGMSVSEAAHEVGYADEFYFSKLFKKEMGLSPTEFAARARVRIANLCGIFSGDLAAIGLQPQICSRRGWEADAKRRDAMLDHIRLVQPDRILTGPLPDPLIADLAKIAPVTRFEWRRYGWQIRLMDIAKLFNLQEIASRWLAEFEQKTRNALAWMQRFGIAKSPFLIVGHRPQNYRIYGRNMRKLADLLYDALQVTPPPAVASIKFIDCKTLHEVAQLNCANVIFLLEFPVSDTYCRQLKEEWRRLHPDAQNMRLLLVRLEEPFIYNASMHERLVDRLVSSLLTEGSGGRA